MKILVDLDGTVADFVTSFARLKGAMIPSPWPELPNRYDLFSALKIDGGRFFEGCDYNFWYNLQLMPDANEIVHTAVKFGQVVFLTKINSMMSTRIGECIQGKLDWIRKHFPGHLNVLFEVDVGKEFIAQKDTVLIDDSDQNTEVFIKYGGKGLLIPRPWNKYHYLRKDNFSTEAYVRETLENWRK